MKLFATIRDNIGVILIFIVVLAGYVLLTDVFHVLNPFLFYSITVIPPLFSEYFGMLIEGLKSSLSLLIWAYMLALIFGIGLGALVGSKKLIRKNGAPYNTAFSAIPVTLLTPYAINLFPSFRIARFRSRSSRPTRLTFSPRSALPRFSSYSSGAFG